MRADLGERRSSDSAEVTRRDGVRELGGRPSGGDSSSGSGRARAAFGVVWPFRRGPGMTSRRRWAGSRGLASDHGHAIYKHRKATVEPVFAQIKFNRKINRVPRRGRAAVLFKWRLVAATRGLMKLHNHCAGVSLSRASQICWTRITDVTAIIGPEAGAPQCLRHWRQPRRSDRIPGWGGPPTASHERRLATRARKTSAASPGRTTATISDGSVHIPPNEPRTFTPRFGNRAALGMREQHEDHGAEQNPV
jgi:hypothetical protein